MSEGLKSLRDRVKKILETYNIPDEESMSFFTKGLGVHVLSFFGLGVVNHVTLTVPPAWNMATNQNMIRLFRSSTEYTGRIESVSVLES